MRNPWGDENEWNGRWSDRSSEWTPDLKKKYNMEVPEDDGRFFMPFLEFLKFFDQVSICFYEEEYKLSSFTDTHESKFLGCYEFQIKTPGNYYVSLSQPDARGFPQHESGQGKHTHCYNLSNSPKSTNTVVMASLFLPKEEKKSNTKEEPNTATEMFGSNSRPNSQCMYSSS